MCHTHLAFQCLNGKVNEIHENGDGKNESEMNRRGKRMGFTPSFLSGWSGIYIE